MACRRAEDSARLRYERSQIMMLGEHGANSNPQGGLHSCLHIMCRQKENWHGRQNPVENFGGFEPVHHGHGHIKYDQIRLELSRPNDGVGPVFGLTAHNRLETTFK
jgi:hypothetical protein